MELEGEALAPKPAATRGPERRKAHGRSKVSNGNDLLPNIDGRSLIARRYRDITSAIYQDQGGIDHLSEARQQLIRRFAAACVLAEEKEAALARGETIDIAEHALLVSTAVRVANRIGIDRRSRIVSPTLKDYIDAGNDDAVNDDEAVE